MRLTTSLLALAALFCLLPASAQYARFANPTDTIFVAGNTTFSVATFEARILLTANTKGWVFYERGASSSTYDEYKYMGLSATTLFGNADSYSGNRTSATPAIPLRRWHHIAYIYNGSQQRLYLNGTLVASTSFNNGMYNLDGRFQIGAYDGSTPAFIGYMDYIRISDVVRYTGNSFTPPKGDLPYDEHTQVLFNFNEPAGTNVLIDPGDLGNDGYLGQGFSGATKPELVSTVPEAGSVSGTVQLKNSLDPEQYLTFEFRKSGSDPFQRKLVLVPTGADIGSFYISGIPTGTYDIAVRGSGYLRKVVPNVVVSGSTSIPLVELIPADINNDNNVDIFDLAVLAEYFNTFGDL